jgi:hypothetical protein
LGAQTRSSAFLHRVSGNKQEVLGECIALIIHSVLCAHEMNAYKAKRIFQLDNSGIFVIFDVGEFYRTQSNLFNLYLNQISLAISSLVDVHAFLLLALYMFFGLRTKPEERNKPHIMCPIHFPYVS